MGFLYASSYGAGTGGDDTVKLQTLFAAAAAQNKTAVLDAATFLVSGTLCPPSALVIQSNDTIIKAMPGIYTEIVTGGMQLATGRTVLFDLKNMTRSRLCGKLTLHCSGIANLCALAASTLVGGFTSVFESLVIQSAYIGIHNQATEASLPGTFTGSYFESIQFIDCANDIWIQGSCDDLAFGVIRSMSTIAIDNNTGVTFTSLYKHGGSQALDGLVIGSHAHVVCTHLYVEGSYRYPILLNGSYAKLTVLDLTLSPTFSSGCNAIVYTGQTSAEININLSGELKQALTPQSSIGIVKLYVKSSDIFKRIVNLSAPFSLNDMHLVLREGAPVSSEDVIYIQCQEGKIYGEVTPTNIDYLKVRKNKKRLEYVSSNGLTYYNTPSFDWFNRSAAGTTATFHFVLPINGTYLLSVVCKGANASFDHSARQAYLVSFSKGSSPSHSIGQIQQLNPIAKVGNAQTLSVTAPTDSGQISVTFTQRDPLIVDFNITGTLLSGEYTF
ncbi:hypothetical protein GK047_14060 [Paenibacillus sp. SYP-B3998]|uniref:Pectate lyase superfamily protein domain-containing protein n=1 Tax=Paenibacillus sp. SYP-B3998 TaxID=2678564 RepID=A0A6G3ZYK0_9BACL|nr:hypothetical protein [Paenibacillus sp. SYP-B3998]NEW07128.1 hypothetical protein [Paenibacillus sp. SYP-B3998]